MFTATQQGPFIPGYAAERLLTRPFATLSPNWRMMLIHWHQISTGATSIAGLQTTIRPFTKYFETTLSLQDEIITWKQNPIYSMRLGYLELEFMNSAPPVRNLLAHIRFFPQRVATNVPCSTSTTSTSNPFQAPTSS
ncbi:hypothetical protein Hypma_007062 [Hypsizygus marmoreus]|uniref:Uncharacterized protein n=1 Tax=Hypsizygus marmoreus TaxID=39966 RepID=A0A369K9A6_HYPMA|nr:hypothetical protein Hypma_007062 [Hypsizygus marmoreus]